MENRLSKSKYIKFCQCPKIIWLDRYHPELAKIDSALQKRFDEGKACGDYAKGLLGKYSEMTAYTDENKLDLYKMIEQTKICLSNGTVNICEASFLYDGAYCAVDILHKVSGGYEIYEVKSSTKISEVYLNDVAYQKYILENCGIKITDIYIVYINHNYIRKGNIELNNFFKIEKVTNVAESYIQGVAENIKEAKRILALTDEPNIDIDTYCNCPYECQYKDYCMRNIPTPSIFDIYRMKTDQKYAYYKQDIVSFTDIHDAHISLNEKQQRQVDTQLFDLPMQIDKCKLYCFLNKLWYPLYFLDFETFQTCIPLFDGMRPYQQVPFQYSLHYIEKENCELKHTEYLAKDGIDPCREIAERLIADIPLNACVLAYNMSFERNRINELAEQFHDLRCELLTIHDNIRDLLTVFQNGSVYNKEMGGSFSIKSVLPAIFPDNSDLNYHNLKDVHNGTEATNAYLQLTKLPIIEKEQLRNNLLAYCKLDTMAMVMLWQQLKLYLHK